MKPFRRFPTYKQLRRWTINHFEKGLEYKIHRIIWNLPLDEYPRIFNNYEKEYIMSKFIKTQTEKTNKNGKVLERILNIQPKKGFVNIEEVNKTYKALAKTTDPSKIMIKIQTIGVF